MLRDFPAPLVLVFHALIISIDAQTFCSYQSEGDGGYKAAWTYDAAANLVQFSLEAKQRLKSGDMITIASIGGKLIATDRHSASYSEPIPDLQQDVQHFAGRVENGVIYANFSRLINTGDGNDKPLEDPLANNCQHFIFPTTGGPVSGDASNHVIEQHINTPKVRLICNIARCRPNINLAATREVLIPTTIAPAIGLKPRVVDPVATDPNNQNPAPSQQDPAVGQNEVTRVQIGTQDRSQTNDPLKNAKQASQQSGKPDTSNTVNGTSGIGPVAATSDFSGSPAGSSKVTLPNQAAKVESNFQPANFFATVPPRQVGSNAFEQSQQANSGSNGFGNSGKYIILTNAGQATTPSVASLVCEFADGSYKAQWTYDDITQRVTINISAPLPHGRWTGIGFGKQMASADMIIIQDSRGRLQVTDRYGTGHEEPLVDSHYDVEAFRGFVEGGHLRASFNRLLNTLDSDDVVIDDPNLNNCQYFIFPTSGGSQTDHGRIQVHDAVPKVKLICNVKDCRKPALNPTPNFDSPTISAQSGQNATQEAVSQTRIQNGEKSQLSIQTGAALSQSGSQNLQGGQLPPLDQGQGNANQQQNSLGQWSNAEPNKNQVGNGQLPVQSIDQQGGQQPSNVRIQKEASSNQAVNNGQGQQNVSIQPAQSEQSSSSQSLINNGQQVSQQQGIQLGQQEQLQTSQPGSLQANAQDHRGQNGLSDDADRKPQDESNHQCPDKEDHEACKTYVDDYLNIVFSRFPRTDIITQKACTQLAKHQDGIVIKECCKYMRFECGEIMKKFLPAILTASPVADSNIKSTVNTPSTSINPATNINSATLNASQQGANQVLNQGAATETNGEKSSGANSINPTINVLQSAISQRNGGQINAGNRVAITAPQNQIDTQNQSKDISLNGDVQQLQSQTSGSSVVQPQVQSGIIQTQNQSQLITTPNEVDNQGKVVTQKSVTNPGQVPDQRNQAPAQVQNTNQISNPSPGQNQNQTVQTADQVQNLGSNLNLSQAHKNNQNTNQNLGQSTAPVQPNSFNQAPIQVQPNQIQPSAATQFTTNSAQLIVSGNPSNNAANGAQNGQPDSGSTAQGNSEADEATLSIGTGSNPIDPGRPLRQSK